MSQEMSCCWCAGGLLYIAGFVFLIAILIGVWFPGVTFSLILSAVGAVLFSWYLISDLQAMMGGHAITLCPDDYVYAAVQVSIHHNCQ